MHILEVASLPLIAGESRATLKLWLDDTRGNGSGDPGRHLDGRFDYFLLKPSGSFDPAPVLVRRGRRTALTCPVFPPPQKN